MNVSLVQRVYPLTLIQNMDAKLSPLLPTCKAYGYTPPGECGLASLGEHESPPPGHVNSLVAMFVRSNAHAYANISYAADMFRRLSHDLEFLAAKASTTNDLQPGLLTADMRDLLVEANEKITNATIVTCGMTGAMRVPDAITMLACTRKNPSGSDCGREVAQPLLQELDAILEGDATDVSVLGAKLQAYWSRLKECGLLLSLTKLQGVRGSKLPPHLMGVLASFREQLFMALAKAPMQVMRRENFAQYALPDCLEAIVRMHNLGPTRALEIASEMGCACLLPGSLDPILQDFRQMSGGGHCSYTNVKSKIKADETTPDAIQAHARIVSKVAKPLKEPHQPKPKVRALKQYEASELAEIKVKNTEKSRERTKDEIQEGPVLFVRTCKKRKTATSSRTGYADEHFASIALQMYRSATGQPLEKDPIATAVSGAFALPYQLTDRPKLLTPKEMTEQSLASYFKSNPTSSPLLEGFDGSTYDEVAGMDDNPITSFSDFNVDHNFADLTDFAALDRAAAEAAANMFV